MDIQELKAKHGANNLFESKITDSDGEQYTFICVKPKKIVLKAVLKNKNDEEKILETLVSNCVVAGDMDALENADVYSKVAEDISKKIGGAKSEVKKL